MVLVIQFREDASLEHEQACIRQYLPVGRAVRFESIFDPEVAFCEPQRLLEGVTHLLLGGSGALVIAPSHDGHDYDKTAALLDRVEPLIRHVLERDFPTLGACFGHQLLGHFAGGTVGFDLSAAEVGFVEIARVGDDPVDPLLQGVPERYWAVTGHQDSVVTLPEGAVRLASSRACANQLIRYGKRVYGAQFHCELTAEQLMERIDLFPVYRKYAAGFNPVPTPFAVRILQNFFDLTEPPPAPGEGMAQAGGAGCGERAGCEEQLAAASWEVS